MASMSAATGAACGGGAGAGAGSLGALVTAALHFFAAASCNVSEPWPPQADVQNMSSFDFIVVGGGSGGAAAAARLARRWRVLLLEAGGDPPPETLIPGFRDHIKAGPFIWNFTTEPEAGGGGALRGGRQRQPRGRLLGGSGAVGDGVYGRGFPADYAAWAAAAGPAWGWPAVLPYFRALENVTDENIARDPELMRAHGAAGPLPVSGRRAGSRAAAAFLGAFRELGYPSSPDMTGPLLGAGRFSHTVRRGRRLSAASALLAPAARAHDSLLVLKHTEVTRLLMENGSAVGVQARRGGESFLYRARREVLLAAGAYVTPQLLQAAGVGPAAALAARGVPVLADLPVGEGLQDHPMVLLYMTARPGTCAPDAAAAHADALRYLADGGGALGRPDTVGAHEPGADGAPRFAVFPECRAPHDDYFEGCVGVLGFTAAVCRRLADAARGRELLSFALVLLAPESRGSVRAGPAGPEVRAGTFSDPRDLDGFPEMMEKVLSVANTSYFRSVDARPVQLQLPQCAGAAGRERLRCEARHSALSAWHGAGSAPLGAVLDARLRVRGVRGLRVADASAMPRIVRSGTDAVAIMIGQRAADFIDEDYPEAAPAAPA